MAVVTRYAICFDFPEWGEPLFAGMTAENVYSFARTLDTAAFYADEQTAERVLANGYGDEARKFGCVVEVGEES